MLDLLLGHLGELRDRTLEIYRVVHYLALGLSCSGSRCRTFSDHVLLGKEKILLVLLVDINVRVFATVNLAIFVLGFSSRTDFELHIVLIFELLSRKLRACQLLNFRFWLNRFFLMTCLND